MTHTILWTRLDTPGHESARLREDGASKELSGSAVFVEDGSPVRLDYAVACDANWKSRSVRVRGWLGDRDVAIDVAVSPAGVWSLNAANVEEVAGCVDADLNFSPSTNLLPIRRLNLRIGESADVRAAWLRFPSFRLEPLEQTYRRVAENVYRYESAGGSFTAELRVNEYGFPLDYAGIWRAI